MQESLFAIPDDQDYCVEHQLGDADILEFPNLFSKEESDRHLKSLIEDITWQQDYLKIAGKTIVVPRLQCWMGDKASNYGYSGIRLSPCPWRRNVLKIRQRVEEISNMKFNSVLLNFYRSGRDSVAWHADDEKELGREPIIASLSFGAARDFQLKHKNKSRHSNYSMTLTPGSMLIMGAGLQESWLHQVPKIEGLQEPRVNLTFRNIVA